MSKQDLQEDLKQAMLSKDQEKMSVLRMLLSAITYYEIQKGGANYHASDEDIMQVIQKEIKQRNDSIEQFTKAKRPGLAEKEKKEADLLLKYLPEQISDEALKTIVIEAIAKTQANSLKDIGKVMGMVLPQVKGKADGARVSICIKNNL